VLHPELLSESDKTNLIEAMDQLPGLVYTENLAQNSMQVITIGEGSINLKRVRNREYKAVHKDKNGFTTEYFKDVPTYIVIMASKESDLDTITLNIDTNNTANNFKGIIYVEGDILLESYFNFYGIMIVRGGSITVGDDVTAKINGVLITDTQTSIPGMTIKKDNTAVSQVGVYLPGCYEPVIDYRKIY
jgi:hypothetical protein